MAETDQRDLLPQIAVPTLLICGERDERSPVSIADELEEAIEDTWSRPRCDRNVDAGVSPRCPDGCHKVLLRSG